MEETIYYNELYDLYGDLLTVKQKMYFEDYYFNNLSLGEMATNYNISRNAIFKQIHISVNKLKEYESKLHLLEKNKKIRDIIKNIGDDKIKNDIEILL